MLEADQIRVGGFYVSEKKGLVREVWKEGNGNAYWHSYDLRSGEATGHSLLCSKYHLSRWADREAGPEEVARMQRDQADKKDMARTMELVDMVLKNIPDKQLLAEVHRRGLDVKR